MKRRISLVIFAILLLSLVFSLSSCGECEHKYGEWETKTNATCTAEGVKVRTCTECGETEEAAIEKSAHSFTSYNSDNNATCTADGTKSAKCDNCDAKDTQPLVGSKKPHSFTNYVDDNNATCSQDATRTAVCDRDGCNATHSIVIENSKVGHELTTTENQPTCTDSAVIITSCANCSYSVSETVDALGHDWSADAPTCEEGVSCSRCEASIPAKGHSYELKSSSEAKCDENGVDIYACSVCADEYETVREYALGHKTSEDAWTLSGENKVRGESCLYIQTYSANCTVCGGKVEKEEEVYKHVHAASIKTAATCSSDGIKVYTCTKTGCSDSYEAKYSDSDNHKWGEGVIDGKITTYTCSLCAKTKKTVSSKEDTETTVDKNTLENAGEVELKDASIALDSDTLSGLSGDVSISADKLLAEDITIPEDLKNAIGDRPIYNFGMKVDGSSVSTFDGLVTVRVPYILAEGEDPECIAVWYIDENGEIQSFKATYSDGYAVFETNHFSYYTVTRLTPEERCALYGHSYKLTVKTPGCTFEGYTLAVCQRCGDSKKSDIVLATGHSFNKTVVDPTCTLPGSVSYFCEGCGLEYFEKIPSLGHNYNVTAENEATCTEPGRVVNTCDRCQHEYVEIEPKLPHAYVDSVITPTCTLPGHTERVCSVCNNKATENYKEALGHNYIETVIEPTCLTDGYTLHKCERCDSEYTTDVVLGAHKWDIEAATCGKSQICLVCGAHGEEATGKHNMVDGTCTVCGQGCNHNYTDSIVPPTCTKEGYTTRTCAICGATERTNIVAALGHKGSGTCTVCGATLEASFYENTFNSLLSGDFVINTTDFFYGSEVYYAGAYVTINDLYYSLDGEGEVVAYGSFSYRLENNEKSDIDVDFYIKDGKVYAKSIDTGVTDIDTSEAFIVTAVDGFLNTAPASIMMIESFLKFYRRDLADVISIIAVTMGSSVEEVTSSVFEWLFAMENKGDGKQFTLDFERVKEINGYLYDNKISTVIELIIGEGRFESFKEGIREVLSSPISELSTKILESGMALSDAERIIDAFVAASTLDRYSSLVDALKTVVEGDYKTLSDFLKTDFAKEHKVIEVVALINFGGSNDTPSAPGDDIIVHAHRDADGDGICDNCGMGFASGGNSGEIIIKPTNPKPGDDGIVHYHIDIDGDKICDSCGMVIGSGDIVVKPTNPKPGDDGIVHYHIDIDGDRICDSCGMVIGSGDNSDDKHDKEDDGKAPDTKDHDGKAPDIGDDHNGNGAAPDTGDQNNGAAPDPILPPVADNNALDKSRSVSYSYSASYGDSFSDGSSNMGSPDKEEYETGTDYDKLIENVVNRIEAFGEMNAYELIVSMFVSTEANVSLATVKDAVDEAIDKFAEKISFSIKTDNNGNITEIKLSISDYKLENSDGESIDGSIVISAGEGDREKYEKIMSEALLAMKDAPSLDGILSDYELEEGDGYIKATQKTPFVHEGFEDITFYESYYEVIYEKFVFTSLEVIIPDSKSLDYVLRGCNGNVYSSFMAEYRYSAIVERTIYCYSYDGTLISTDRHALDTYSGSGNSVAIVLSEDGSYVFCPMSIAQRHRYDLEPSKTVNPSGCTDYGERHLVCKDCDKSAVLYFRAGHTIDTRYTLLGDSCEDGYTVRGICTVCEELIYEVEYNEHLRIEKTESLSFAGLCEHHGLTLVSCACGEYSHLDFDGFGFSLLGVRACAECGYSITEKESSRREGCTVYYETTYTVKNKSGSTVFTVTGVSYASTEHDYDVKVALMPGSITCEDGIKVEKVCKICGDKENFTTNWHESYTVKSIDLARYGAQGKVVYIACACGLEKDITIITDESYEVNYEYDTGTNIDGLYCDNIERYRLSSGLVVEVKNCYEKQGCEIKNYSFIFIEGERLGRFEMSVTYEHVMRGEATLKGDSCYDGVTVDYTCILCGKKNTERYDHHYTYLKEAIILDDYKSTCGGYLGIRGCACGENKTYISRETGCDFDSEMIYWEDEKNYFYVYTCSVTSPKCGFRYAVKSYSVKDGCEENLYLQILVGCDQNGENAIETFTYALESVQNHIVDCYKQNAKNRDVLCERCNETLDGILMESWIRHTGSTPKNKENADGTVTYYSGDYCSDCGCGSYWIANGNKGDTVYENDTYLHVVDGDRYEFSTQENYYVDEGGDMYRDVITFSYKIYLFDGAKLVELERDSTENEEYLYFFEEGFNSAYRELYGREYDHETDGCKRIVYSHKSERPYLEDACKTISGWAEATCTQDGESYDLCKHCGKGYREVHERARGHKWHYDKVERLYVCDICGLENANGADGDIVIEDLTYMYGDGETYVVGYMNRKGIEFITNITIILESGEEILIDCIEFTYSDTGRRISFSRLEVIEEATKLGYSPDEYDIRISFVPIDAATDLDYAITFK